MVDVPSAFRVKFRHERLFDKDMNVQAKGGTTHCTVHRINSDGTTGEAVAYAQARCHSSEHYNKRIGRDVSYGRCAKIIWGNEF